MAGHLAWNQVHAGSIPAALPNVGSPPGRSDALQATPDGFDSRALHILWVSAPGRAVGLQSRRTAFESLLTRNADRMASVTTTNGFPEVSNLVRALGRRR
jgi:hypothetical protein